MGSGKVKMMVLAVCIATCNCLPVSSLESQTEVREKRDTLGGAALGAAAGTVVAGPVGTVVGGIIGGFIGHEVHKSNQESAANGVRSAPVGGITNAPRAPVVVVATAAPAVVIPATVDVATAVPVVVVPVAGVRVSSGEATGVNPTISGSATSA
ncbi:hypothetical protein RvY_13335 [Ramazzottius varieornatus]|uniref:Glycine zipper domain-containing protein n=1 Tax=Ramazzottius varieornatus TaxID=947166 RepID=A0A1D1VMJ3_RAMVA|nr:hypothetical protein RvY_13335 [Ramazzottius varieornatus]